MKLALTAVLRYAEYYNSPMIGVDYWLFNMMGAKKELRYLIHSSFKNAKMFLNPQTSFTDIARLISVDVYRANQAYYSSNDLSSLIVRKLNYCKQYEQLNRRPIKISKNLIQDGIDSNLFPFPLIADSTTPVTRRAIDKHGKELPDTYVR
jgi:competence CoiA-like predicted nuclease